MRKGGNKLRSFFSVSFAFNSYSLLTTKNHCHTRQIVFLATTKNFNLWELKIEIEIHEGRRRFCRDTIISQAEQPNNRKREEIASEKSNRLKKESFSCSKYSEHVATALVSSTYRNVNRNESKTRIKRI